MKMEEAYAAVCQTFKLIPEALLNLLLEIEKFGESMKVLAEHARPPINCHDCGAKPKLVDSKVIYGRTYGLIWICSNFPKCENFVGVHKGTKWALGTMANKKLRLKRKAVHAEFDPLWKSTAMSRRQAYIKFSELMGKADFHIGESTEEECDRALNVVIPQMRQG